MVQTLESMYHFHEFTLGRHGLVMVYRVRGARLIAGPV